MAGPAGLRGGAAEMRWTHCTYLCDGGLDWGYLKDISITWELRRKASSQAATQTN